MYKYKFKEKESKKFSGVNLKEEYISLPFGFFLVTKSFELSAGGAWSVRFKKGSLLKYKSDKTLSRWDGLTQEWKNITPMRHKSNFDISNYGLLPDQRNMLATFLKNTKEIKGTKELSKIKDELSISKEFTVLYKDVSKTLSSLNLKPNQKIKIVIE